MPDIYVAVI